MSFQEVEFRVRLSLADQTSETTERQRREITVKVLPVLERNNREHKDHGSYPGPCIIREIIVKTITYLAKKRS